RVLGATAPPHCLASEQPAQRPTQGRLQAELGKPQSAEGGAADDRREIAEELERLVPDPFGAEEIGEIERRLHVPRMQREDLTENQDRLRSLPSTTKHRAPIEERRDRIAPVPADRLLLRD